MSKVYPTTTIKNKDNGDDLYNISLGIICGSCICILVCVALIVVISLVIDEHIEYNTTGSNT
mgnify:FL=1